MAQAMLYLSFNEFNLHVYYVRFVGAVCSHFYSLLKLARWPHQSGQTVVHLLVL